MNITDTQMMRCTSCLCTYQHMRNLQVSFAKEPYERDDILQKRPIIFMT